MISLPPKLYLDTNHIVQVSKIHRGLPLGSSEMYRDDYIFINKCIQEAASALIFNFHAPLEWVEGRATEESALQLASIFDKAECIYQLESDNYIYLSELLEECKRLDASVVFPKLPILHYLQKGSQYTPAETTISKHVSEYSFGSTDKSTFPDYVPVVSISEHVRETLRWTQKNPDVCKERIKGHNETVRQDIEYAGDVFIGFSQDQIVGWMKRFLQIDKVLRVASPRADIDALLAKIDITKCRATYLYIRIRENLIRRRYRSEENDCDDFIYLPAIPYADFSLIERRFAGWILQAKEDLKARVFCRPMDAANAVAEYLNIERF